MSHVRRHHVIAPALAYSMLIGVMLMWASGVVAARSVHTLVPPIGFSFWRWCIASAVLAPFAGPAVLREWRQICAHAGHFALLGLFIAGGSTLLVSSVQYTTATNAGLVSAAQPIVTAVIAWLLIDERLTRRQSFGVLAAAAGLLLMITRMDLAVVRQWSFNRGDLLVSAAIVFYAMYAVNLHKWVGAFRPLIIMQLTCVAGMCMVLPFYLFETITSQPFDPQPAALAATFYMALIPTLSATSMWNLSVGAVGVNRASSFINLLPLFSTGLAVCLLGEQLHSYHLIGGALVCVGITLVVKGQKG